LLRYLVGDQVAVLINDGCTGRLVLPATAVEPGRGMFRVPWRLAGTLDGIPRRAGDQDVGIRAGLDRLGERPARRLLGNASRVSRPEPIERLGELGLVLALRRVLSFFFRPRVLFKQITRSDIGGESLTTPSFFFLVLLIR